MANYKSRSPLQATDPLINLIVNKTWPIRQSMKVGNAAALESWVHTSNSSDWSISSYALHKLSLDVGADEFKKDYGSYQSSAIYYVAERNHPDDELLVLLCSPPGDILREMAFLYTYDGTA